MAGLQFVHTQCMLVLVGRVGQALCRRTLTVYQWECKGTGEVLIFLDNTDVFIIIVGTFFMGPNGLRICMYLTILLF